MKLTFTRAFTGLLLFVLTVSSGIASGEYICGHFVGRSPKPLAMSPEAARQYAKEAADQIEHGFVVRGDGRSMEPLYTSGTLLVIEPVPYASLQRGATVLYRNKAGLPVTHLLVARARDGWRATGLNNRRADAEPVNVDNFIGVVTAAVTPATSRPLSGGMRIASQ